MSSLLRSGRLKPAKKDAISFTSSVKDDEKILKQIVDVNKAHIIMLIEEGIIGRESGGRILQALDGLEGRIKIKPEHEDAHVAIEEAVVNAAGEEAGGNLNLAKSRNDQVATAIRMRLRLEVIKTAGLITDLQEAILRKTEENIESVIPGYTHLQPAQPITFAHYLIAQFDALHRDLSRLKEAYSRINLSPMGAGALATTSLPISRERTAELLGFDGIIENSLDAVSTRDFLLETLAVLSIMAVDISRMAEDMIVWSTMEFGLIELPDEYAFTSSIMPQKKNPDVLEVIRARMSLILGDFTSSAIMLKALPAGYNLDFQEATPILWRAIENIQRCLKILAKIILNLKVRPEAVDRPELSFMAATELANMLVKDYGVPFRTAHRIVGAAVKNLIDKGMSLKDLTPKLLAELYGEIVGSQIQVKKEDLAGIIDISGCVELCSVRGGPSRKEAERMLRERRALLADSRMWIREKKDRLEAAEEMLNRRVKELSKSIPNRNV